ncbi:MAG: tetratricopeptide repeat protein [Bacteroidota bacterium]
MKKIVHFKLLMALLLLFSPMLLPAQDEAAPLVERMLKSSGKGRVDLMNKISEVYRKTDRLKSLGFARQASKLAVDINYSQGEALASKNEGICWFFMGNNDSARFCYRQAADIYTRTGDKTGMSACFNNLGLVAQETGKYDDALRFYRLSIDMDQKLGDEKGGATTKRNLVDIYIYKGNSREALRLSDEILASCHHLKDKEGIMRTLINRAAIYDNLKRYEEAIRDQKAAISIAVEIKDTYAEAMARSNYGLVTWHMGKPEEALQILNQVLTMSDESDDGYDILNTLWIISEIYTSRNEYAKSNEILLNVLRKLEASDNKRQEAKVLTSLGRNLMELNEVDKAEGYFRKSLEITVLLNAPFEMLENYRNLAHASAILHNFKEADSLQDLFAETYLVLFNADSIAETRKVSTNINAGKDIRSPDTANWLIALLLFILTGIWSVYGFVKR